MGVNTQQLAEWRVVQTDAGPVTLASVDDLRSRAAAWREWAASATASAKSLRDQADERLAAAGAILVPRSSDWAIPAELQMSVPSAKAIMDRVSADDQQNTALKGQESSAGVFGRIRVHHQEHQVEYDRSHAAMQLRSMLIQIAKAAPPVTVAEADEQRKAAADLEAQAASLEGQTEAAQGWAGACDDEVGRREDAIKAMGFDSLYEAAELQTSGVRPVDSPLVLKKGELAYLSVSATLARMVTRTHYVGGSTGFSFPIGHTGIRYRVGSFRGQPIHQDSLSKIDTGTLVVTNQRLAYVGRTKSTSMPLSKVMHVEVFNDGLSIAREGKENPDFFLTSNPKHVVFLLNWSLSHQAGS